MPGKIWDCSQQNNQEKPPIGLVPKIIRQEQRLNEIIEAINRYFEAKKRIPDEWIEEYHELIYQLNKTWK